MASASAPLRLEVPSVLRGVFTGLFACAVALAAVPTTVLTPAWLPIPWALSLLLVPMVGGGARPASGEGRRARALALAAPGVTASAVASLAALVAAACTSGLGGLHLVAACWSIGATGLIVVVSAASAASGGRMVIGVFATCVAWIPTIPGVLATPNLNGLTLASGGLIVALNYLRRR